MRVSNETAYRTAARLAVEHADVQGLGLGLPDAIELGEDLKVLWYRLIAILAGRRLATNYRTAPPKTAAVDAEAAEELVLYFGEQGFDQSDIWEEAEAKAWEVVTELWPLIDRTAQDYRTTGRCEIPSAYLAMDEELRAAKSLERKARREAKRLGLVLIKSQSPINKSNNKGAFKVIDPSNDNEVIGGERFDWTAEDVIKYCQGVS